MTYGTHIELFLVDGEAGGITTADIASWTGHLLLGPRSRLSELLSRDEARRNGVYLLLGDDPAAVGHTRCYIGKTEDFTRRFREHSRTKDWWDRTVLISSSDDSFNEGHWGYIESRLIEIATVAARATLDENKQVPQQRKLSEAQRSDAEAFIERVRTVLPVLGILVLKTYKRGALPDDRPCTEAQDSPVFHLDVPRSGIAAHAQVIDGEFLLLAGSVIAGQWRGKAGTASTRRTYDAFAARLATFVADGSVVVKDDLGTLTRDIPFTSASTAGAIASGRSCNGRREWRTETGMSFGDWEERGTEDVGIDHRDTTTATAAEGSST